MNYILLQEVTDQTIKKASTSRLPEVWILHHSPLKVFIPVRRTEEWLETLTLICWHFASSQKITHHLRMELAGTYISEGFGVICDWDSAKDEVKLYRLSSIFCVNCEIDNVDLHHFSLAVENTFASEQLQSSRRSVPDITVTLVRNLKMLWFIPTTNRGSTLKRLKTLKVISEAAIRWLICLEVSMHALPV